MRRTTAKAPKTHEGELLPPPKLEAQDFQYGILGCEPVRVQDVQYGVLG